MAMGRELDNANPTIVNVSDLPTRRREKRNQVVRLVGDDAARWSTSQGIFGDAEDLRAGTADSDDGGDPIDEQEIYGKPPLLGLPISALTNQPFRFNCHNIRPGAPSYPRPARCR